MRESPPTSVVRTRAATPADLAGILALLQQCGLTTAGVAGHLGEFLVTEEGGRITGTAGLEVYGDAALLRSVAVAPTRRERGIGRELVRAALETAAARGVSTVALLTTTAARYFAGFGFHEVSRESLDPRLEASAEFGDEACATAVAMVRTLGEE